MEVIIMKNDLTEWNGGFLSPLFDFLEPEEYRVPKYARGLNMKTDIKSDEKNYVMEIELPGIKKEDIDISLNNGYLTVKAKAEHQEKEGEGKKNFIHRERFSGVASRSYYVGDVDEKSITASFNNGVLTLSFPKERKVENNEHRISIQ